MTTPTINERIEEQVRTLLDEYKIQLTTAFKVLHHKFMTAHQFSKMARNAAYTESYGITCHSKVYNPPPVIKLFTPDANATWLLSEIDLHCPYIAFGLCDLGVGFPELGYVDLREIFNQRGGLGLPVERDLHFNPNKTLLDYANTARAVGYITV
jgi:hypothetical protein